MKIKDVITRNIIKYCNDKNMDVKDLANSAGLKEERLNHLLKMGVNKRLTVTELDKIARALDIPITDLFDGYKQNN